MFSSRSFMVLKVLDMFLFLLGLVRAVVIFFLLYVYNRWLCFCPLKGKAQWQL